MTPATKERRQPPCGEHRSRRQAGCHTCRLYAAWYKRQRTRAVAEGTWQPLQPLGPVTDHVHALMRDGWAQTQIAERAGVPLRVVQRLATQKIKTGVLGVTAEALLGLTGPAPSTRFVPAAGTHRRLRALSAIGWPRDLLADRLGVPLGSLIECMRREQVTPATAERVRQVYDALSGTPGPSNIARGRARAYGFAPPLAWDDDTIDDPAAQPAAYLVDAPAATFDETTVGQAAEGRLTYGQLNVHRPDLVETVRRLARTLSDLEIAHLLRWPGADTTGPDGKTRGQGAVCKLREREGIPAAPRHAAMVPDARARDRAAARSRQRAAKRTPARQAA